MLKTDLAFERFYSCVSTVDVNFKRRHVSEGFWAMLALEGLLP